MCREPAKQLEIYFLRLICNKLLEDKQGKRPHSSQSRKFFAHLKVTSLLCSRLPVRLEHLASPPTARSQLTESPHAPHNLRFRRKLTFLPRKAGGRLLPAQYYRSVLHPRECAFAP